MDNNNLRRNHQGRVWSAIKKATDRPEEREALRWVFEQANYRLPKDCGNSFEAIHQFVKRLKRAIKTIP